MPRNSILTIAISTAARLSRSAMSSALQLGLDYLNQHCCSTFSICTVVQSALLPDLEHLDKHCCSTFSICTVAQSVLQLDLDYLDQLCCSTLSICIVAPSVLQLDLDYLNQHCCSTLSICTVAQSALQLDLYNLDDHYCSTFLILHCCTICTATPSRISQSALLLDFLDLHCLRNLHCYLISNISISTTARRSICAAT